MNLYDSLPDAAATVFGAEALAEFSYDVLTVDVPVGSWISALEIARDKLGCTYFDWLSAVDEPGTGFRICAHVVSLENKRVRRLLLRTTVPHGAPSLPSAVAVYAGAEWHERETFEMFGVVFTDHPHLVPLLLPENFEGHPLRKDFVLAARVAKAWPGAKEPGEGADPDGPKRRQMLPPGVPDPNDWGPLKGQLPPAPTRPARTPRAAGAAPREGAPARRTRSAAEASAPRPTTETPQRGAPSAPDAPASRPPTTDTPRTAATPPRRSRSTADGSASQAEPAPEPGETPEATAPQADPTPAAPRTAATAPRRSRSTADGSASQAAPPDPDAQADAPQPPGRPQATRRAAPRSADAPWHDPKPAFEEPPATPKPEPEAQPAPTPGPKSKATPEAEPAPTPGPEAEPPSTPTSGPEANPTTDTGGDA
ncbi:NADH-quinone oxidoreductase subunit C [Streptomyces sp. NPDC055254]